MSEIYDTAILGAGPAGISAAIYAARAKLNTIWLDRQFARGGQILNTYEVDNYPGLPGISGMDLGEKMGDHAAGLGMEPVRENVLSVEDAGEVKIIRTKKNEYRARTVIIACGARHRMLEISGEQELSGRGVSYCATCDGAFFKDKVVAVIGGGNIAAEDALFLSRICRKVYMVHRRDALRADQILRDSLHTAENIEMIWNSTATEIQGMDCVTGLKLCSVKDLSESVIAVDGVFIAVGTIPDTEKFKGIVSVDESGYIIAGEDGITSAPGIFAAGDIRTKRLRQVVTAAADGANAVNSVLNWMQAAISRERNEY